MKKFVQLTALVTVVAALVVPAMAHTVKAHQEKPILTIKYIAPHPDDCFLTVKVDHPLMVTGACPKFVVTGALSGIRRSSISINNNSAAGYVHILLRDFDHVDANVGGDLLYSTDNVKFYGHNRHFILKDTTSTVYIKTVPGKSNYSKTKTQQ